MKRTAIVGDSWAGIAVALNLSLAGWKPVVLAQGTRLCSEWPCSVPFVVSGGDTYTLDLLEELGLLETVRWGNGVMLSVPPRPGQTCSAGRWPAPFHLLRPIRQWADLSTDARLSVARVFWMVAKMNAADVLGVSGQSMREFLADQRQPKEAFTSVWEPLLRAGTGVESDRVSAVVGVSFLKRSLLRSRWSVTLGVCYGNVPKAMLNRLKAVGAEVHFKAGVAGIVFDGVRVGGVVTSSGIVHAGGVVSAVAPSMLQTLASIPMQRADARLRQLSNFTRVDRLDVLLRFSEDSAAFRFGKTAPDFLVTPMGPVDRFVRVGNDEVHAVMLAPGELVDREDEAIVTVAVEALARAVPAARGLVPIGSRVLRDLGATCAPSVDVEVMRPSSRASVQHGSGGVGILNLALAGEFCATTLPPGREGAIRSGYDAAAAISGFERPVTPIPHGWLAKRLRLA